MKKISFTLAGLALGLTFALVPRVAFAAQTKKMLYIYGRCHYQPHLPKDVKEAWARVDIWTATPDGRKSLDGNELPTALMWDYDTLSGTYFGAQSFELPSEPVSEITIRCRRILKNGREEFEPAVSLQPIRGYSEDEAVRTAWFGNESMAFEVTIPAF